MKLKRNNPFRAALIGAIDGGGGSINVGTANKRGLRSPRIRLSVPSAWNTYVKISCDCISKGTVLARS